MREGVISHFKIHEKLGSGGMGEVYRAEDLKLKRQAAIKFLHPHITLNEEEKSRFEVEAQAAAALNHPNITTIYSIEEVNGELFIVMEYVDGITLADKIRSGPLPLNEVVNIGLQVAAGLKAAHAKGIIHRDIKSSNIMITADNRVKIMDFGLAKIKGGDRLTKIGTTMGTTAYMSPEQTRGEEVDYRTDYWAFGVILYELITGETPFKGDYEQAVIYSILNEEPYELNHYRSSVPASFQHIINKLLNKKKDLRYNALDDLINDLNSALKEKPGILKRLNIRNNKLLKYSLIFLVPVLATIVYFQYGVKLTGEDSLLSGKIPLAVILFENETGDSSYNYLKKVIPNLLITNLEQTDFYDIATLERMNELARQMKNSADAFADQTNGFEICREKNISNILLGSFSKAGDVFITNVKVMDSRSRKLLASHTAKGTGAESILLQQVDEITREISLAFDESKTEQISNLKLISDVTTSSLEAYYYYLRGDEELNNLNWENAKNLLLKAVEKDSLFAMAYTALGLAYSYLYDLHAMKMTMEKAINLSYRTTEKEKLITESVYAILVENNILKYIEINERLERRYPEEIWPHMALGYIYERVGRLDDALKQWNKLLELDPTHANTLNQMGYVFLKRRDYNNAEKYFNRLIEASPGKANPFDSMGDLYFTSGDLEKAYSYYYKAYELSSELGAQTRLAYIHALKQNFNDAIMWTDRLALSAPSAGAKSVAHLWSGYYCFLLSDFERAYKHFDKAIQFARETNSRLLIGGTYYVLSWFDLELERSAPALANNNKWIEYRRKINIELSNEINLDRLIFECWHDLKFNSSTAYEKHSAEINDLVSRLSGPDSLRLYNLNTLLNTGILMLKKNYTAAVKNRREIYFPELSFNFRMIQYNLPPQTDLTAISYEKLGQPDKAIEEYKKITYYDPHSLERRIIHPVYHYRLGLLYEEKGMIKDAVSEYQLYLDIHKNSDAANPILNQVKIRLRRLLN